jgi:hypothetical protein
VKEHILVVEVDETIKELVGDALTEGGYQPGKSDMRPRSGDPTPKRAGELSGARDRYFRTDSMNGWEAAARRERSRPTCLSCTSPQALVTNGIWRRPQQCRSAEAFCRSATGDRRLSIAHHWLRPTDGTLDARVLLIPCSLPTLSVAKR